MKAQIALQTMGALGAIGLGVLFFIFLPHDIQDVTTNAFFIGAGLLLLRSTFKGNNKPPALPQKDQSKKPEKDRRKQRKK